MGVVIILYCLVQEVMDSQGLRGRAADAAAASCLYIACRKEGVPRTLKELCAVSKVPKKEISRFYRVSLKALKMPVEAIAAGDFVSRFCSNLDLPSEVQEAASAIAETATDRDLVPGKSPLTISAAAIYMASQVGKNRVITSLRHMKNCINSNTILDI